jgi:diacylglycerol kinase family enzyme
VLIVILDGGLPEAIVIGAAAFGAVTAAKAAVSVHVPLADAAPPAHPVLFYNPKSGGGKAERFKLADEARARGIEPIELTRGADLEQLVRDAVARGADGLAMAGGDGSQAIVASVAAELDLPYACIPAGTRNHFALDLGVDRDDVVGALDSFVDGGERRVDLAEVNDRVFVNNVSLGLYAEAVQREGYREAKLRTILDTLPDTLGPEGEGIDLRWTEPDGSQHSSGAAILVSNNRYRLGKAVGSGSRPRIDDGLLGITVAGAPSGDGDGGRLVQRPLREWSAPEFEIQAEGPVPAGIDGEALMLQAPLRFRIRPSVLRVRIAPQHPGASPSAAIPEGIGDGIRTLLARAAGHQLTPHGES